MKRSHGPVVRGSIFAGGNLGAGSNPGVVTSRFFFFFFLSFLYPLAFLLFILTADPVTFARFLRKRISSNVIKQLVSASAVRMSRY